jgi:hypothetical protein
MLIKNEEQVKELKRVMKKLIMLDGVFEEEMLQVFHQNIKLLENMEQRIEESQETCSKNLECNHCHNIFEFLYHPSIYKSLPCTSLGNDSCPGSPSSSSKKLTPETSSPSIWEKHSNTLEDSEISEDSEPESHHESPGPCNNSHCPYSHESPELETLQECTEAPFYKFAYNRIKPGSFFVGTSFFSNRSENLIYQEDRILTPPTQNFNIPNMMNINGQFSMPHHHPNMPHAHNMDPQKLYFNTGSNMWGNPMFQSKAQNSNKENMNYMNFASPVNMNMYRIQMNNTFLMPHQQMPMNGGFGQMPMGGYGGVHNRGRGKGFGGGMYRC